MKMEADIVYTTQDLIDNNIAVVLEENRWSWDEPVNDSGQVRRITREYAYRLQVAPSGKVLDFKMLGDYSPTWENYARNYYEQGIPVFPEEEIPIGYS